MLSLRVWALDSSLTLSRRGFEVKRSELCPGYGAFSAFVRNQNGGIIFVLLVSWIAVRLNVDVLYLSCISSHESVMCTCCRKSLFSIVAADVCGISCFCLNHYSLPLRQTEKMMSITINITQFQKLLSAGITPVN